MNPARLFIEFFKSEKAGGVLLMGCTVLSMYLANSPWQVFYLDFWDISLQGHPLVHWINDGLMAIFFLLIGLELEREIYSGELSSVRSASLPVFAAIGGMVVPAFLYLSVNAGLPTQDGAGIPMATDIAFAIGVLSLLGNRVPTSLKVLLTALAVIDDLGAILIIAFAYTSSLAWANLFLALVVFAVLLLLNRLRVHSLWPYLIGGIAMWYFMLHSGVHATITGVLLAFAIPYGDGSEKTPSWKIQHALHKPVAFLILPLFALANTCLVFGDGWKEGLTSAASLGIALGLVVGKPLGIFLVSFLAVKIGWARLAPDMKWKHVFGVGLLGGIGFTMSIFIALLAFDDAPLILSSKMAILASSLTAGLLGFIWLAVALAKKGKTE